VPVEIFVRGKDADENKKQFQTCLETLKKAGKKIAVPKKETATGAFADEWKAALQEAGYKEEDQVDLAPILSNAALSIKDERELVSQVEGISLQRQLTIAAYDPRCRARFERSYDQLLRRRNVRHP
jgi:nucleosome binding factor SPN SPT16 subunit